jgi:hypothetical protein
MDTIAERSAIDFESWLAPVSLDQFFAAYWNQRPLYVPGQGERFAGFFSRAAFEAALPRCKQLKAGFYDQKGWFCDVPITPPQVKRLWDANMTICAGVLPEEGNLARIISAYRRVVAFPGEVYFNAYMSPDGHGFALHIDDHPVWILQIEGVKHWSISPDIGVPEPVRAFSFPPDRTVLKLPWGTFERPDESRFLELLLKPGDLLYLPAGTWHKAKASGFSLGLTMAASPHMGLDLARAAVTDALARYPALVRRRWGVDARGAAADAEVAPVLETELTEISAALRDWATSLDPQALYRLWRASLPKA